MTSDKCKFLEVMMNVLSAASFFKTKPFWMPPYVNKFITMHSVKMLRYSLVCGYFCSSFVNLQNYVKVFKFYSIVSLKSRNIQV